MVLNWGKADIKSTADKILYQTEKRTRKLLTISSVKESCFIKVLRLQA